MENFVKVVSDKFLRITWFLMLVLLMNGILAGCSLMALNKADWGFVVAGFGGLAVLFTVDVWIVRFIKRWIVKQYTYLTTKESK